MLQLIGPFIWIWETSMAWYQPVVITGREMGAGKNLNHWIIKSVDYLHPTKMLILITDFFFSAYTVGGFLHCSLHGTVTEALHSDDQFAHSYSNPYKLYQLSTISPKRKIFQRTETLEYPQKVDIKV